MCGLISGFKNDDKKPSDKQCHLPLNCAGEAWCMRTCGRTQLPACAGGAFSKPKQAEQTSSEHGLAQPPQPDLAATTKKSTLFAP